MKRGDVVAVVETQKGAIEIEIFEAGVLDRILVQPGEKVPVGTLMATLRSNGAQEPEPAPPRPPPELRRSRSLAGAAAARAALQPRAEQPREVPPEVRLAAQPPVEIPSRSAWRRASALGAAVGIRGTGPDGAVTLADVEAAAEPRLR